MLQICNTTVTNILKNQTRTKPVAKSTTASPIKATTLPENRSLTSGEIKMAQLIFGDAID